MLGGEGVRRGEKPEERDRQAVRDRGRDQKSKTQTQIPICPNYTTSRHYLFPSPNGGSEPSAPPIACPLVGSTSSSCRVDCTWAHSSACNGRLFEQEIFIFIFIFYFLYRGVSFMSFDSSSVSVFMGRNVSVFM